ERLDPDEKFLLTKFKGKHSAEKAYGLKGLFAKDDETRSMRITVSADAASHVFHPAVRTIPESQEKSLFINPVYTVDLLDEENRSHSSKLDQLIRNITAPRYQFKLNWDDGFLVIWDNRRVIHRAEGGYDGYDRLLLRVTIGNERPR
ncbi:MAG: TauD/TfdA family dioxygenase, partial [Pseudomonadota bacterium]|nr:TauD/TfdA family dioxygenase [Pseudomonadota bacterium]